VGLLGSWALLWCQSPGEDIRGIFHKIPRIPLRGYHQREAQLSNTLSLNYWAKNKNLAKSKKNLPQKFTSKLPSIILKHHPNFAGILALIISC
jgi:hypothetical protein